MQILIAKNSRLVLEALEAYLTSLAEDLSIIRAFSFDDVVDQCRDNAPDIVLLDEALDGLSLMENLHQLCKNCGNSRILLLVDNITIKKVQYVLACGAAGCVPREFSGHSLLKVLELILEGEKYVPATVFVNQRQNTAHMREAAQSEFEMDGTLPGLTPRENDVLRLLVQGQSNKEIAGALNRKEITVTSHLKQIFHKLGARNRTEAAIIALRRMRDGL